MLPIAIDWSSLNTALIVGAGGFALHWIRQVNASLSSVVHSAQLLESRLDDQVKLCETRHNASNARISDVVQLAERDRDH